MSLGRSAKRVAVLTLVTVAAIAAGTAAASQRTQLRIYTPFGTSGTPAVRITSTIRGLCWTGSLAAARDDAWRCMSANFIFDPCFSSNGAKGIVLCPVSGPWSSTAVQIRLTRTLPGKYGNRGRPSTSELPWALVTTSGWKCSLVTGATTVLDGRRANYGCTGTKDWLWGAPSRRPEPWTIYAGPISAKKLSRRVAIKDAWA